MKKTEKKPAGYAGVEKITRKPEIEEVKEITLIEDKPLVPADYKSKLTRQQVELIKNTIAKGASDDELKMFLYVCERTRLDPFTKQIHLVPRWDSRLGKETRMPIVGIDGLRSVAERTANYAGNDDPTYDDEAKPTKATVTVYKIVQGQRVGFTASARWTQYFPGEKQGFMWNKMPHLMLGKCAEALALRKAFPSVMSGLYVAEEMQQAQSSIIGTISQPRASQQATQETEGDFDKAIRMIKATVDAKGLSGMRSKIQQSEKYTLAEKNKIVKALEARIAELEPKVEKVIDISDEPEEDLL